jgi:periplasmic copper chaperone A
MLRPFAALGLILLGAVTPASAQSPNTIAIKEAWSRATPGGAKVGAGYVTIENTGGTADRLLGAESEVAVRVEIHETSESGGVSRMTPVEALAVAPGARLEFKPGGYHLMLVDLKRPLKQGERFAGVLRFEAAGRVNVQFEVRAIGAGAGTHHAH